MKILCADTFVDGHHCAYMKGLCKNSDIEFVFAVPQYVEDLPNNAKQHIIPYDLSKRGFLYNIEWLRSVCRIAEEENPDVVHFLYGDLFYRSLGIGLGFLKHYKTIITYHVVPNDSKHKISVKMISKRVDYSIVHTEVLHNQLARWNVGNAIHVDYPCFFQIVNWSQENVRRELNIPSDAIVFGCLGGTRRYKGLDFLLEAFKRTEGNFHLLIAGTEEYFTRDYIQTQVEEYHDKVTLVLHRLSDEEFIKCIIATDWIVLPYRKEFTGASGPLAEGVMYNKKILASNIGSIGDLISKYDLGYVFESENVLDLAQSIKKIIYSNWDFSAEYLHFQKMLSPDIFAEKYHVIYNGLATTK